MNTQVKMPIQTPPGAERGGRHHVTTGELVIAIVAAMILSLIVLACGSDSDSTEVPAADVPDGVQQVGDDYIDALVAEDAEAWQATITDDYFHRRYVYPAGSSEYREEWSLEEDDARGYLHRINFFGGLEFEQIGTPVVTGDGPWFVSLGEHFRSVEACAACGVFDGNATYAVVERDGELKISSETFVGAVDVLPDD